VAREQGISEAEIGAIQGIAMAVAAGKINVLMREHSSKETD